MSRSFREADLKLLWGLAAARCAFPDCRAVLVAAKTRQDPAAVLGEIAHIVASSDQGPRCDPEYPAEQRDRYRNLLLLCPSHHTLVDKQPNTYTVADLTTWKDDHERWVRVQLAEEMPGVGFAELEILTRGILNFPAPESEEFVSLAPAEKMAQNGLTDRVRFELTMGLSKAREVRSFVAAVARTDPKFPEMLKAGFVNEYRRLKAAGVEGDGLFEGLRDFAALGRRDFRSQAAGLTVLAYLFEACEVFER